MDKSSSQIAINIQKAKTDFLKLTQVLKEKSIQKPDADGDVHRILLPIIELLEKKITRIAKACSEFQDSIFDNFIIEVNKYTKGGNQILESISSHLLRMGYALLIEYSFLLGKSHDQEVEEILMSTRAAINKSDNAHLLDLSDIVYSYPYIVLKRYMSGSEVQEMLKMPANIKRAREDANSIVIEAGKIKDLFGQMEILWNDVRRHYHTAVLVEGFSEMRADKIKEKEDAEMSNFILGGLMIALPVFQVFIFLFLGDSNFAKGYIDRIAYIAPPLIAMELAIFYFFRIALSNYKSINAQILQIDLRIALSQFFKGYQDYNKNLPAAERSGLEKFESMIFSGIAPNDAGIPTTFDGMGELAKLIEAVKK